MVTRCGYSFQICIQNCTKLCFLKGEFKLKSFINSECHRGLVINWYYFSYYRDLQSTIFCYQFNYLENICQIFQLIFGDDIELNSLKFFIKFTIIFNHLRIISKTFDSILRIQVRSFIFIASILSRMENMLC